LSLQQALHGLEKAGDTDTVGANLPATPESSSQKRHPVHPH
jgi:hypothetical protein